MKNQLINPFFSSEMPDNITNWFTVLVDKIETNLSSADNMHLLAIVLAALAAVTLFFISLYLIILLFSFVFFRKKKRRKAAVQISTEDVDEDKASSEESHIVEDKVDETVLESELQKELEQNQANAEEEFKKDLSASKEEILLQEELNNSISENRELVRNREENQLIELDWKKTSRQQQNQADTQAAPIQQSVTNVRKTLHDLVGMIVNMIGRNIDELKIAQALMYRCKDDISEETVLQIVHSVKEFLSLCNQGAFDNVRRMKDLPSDEDCILHLIAGDTSYAMALMEALMDDRINQAVSMKNSAQREALFKQSSNYACCFGTLAEVNDIKLASASFELAIEMYPDNPVAWSRCADLYKKMGMDDKANWAYRNVLELIKQGEDKSQEANARKYLSQYMYAQGEGNQASQLYMQSKTYYDSIGINRPLDKKELEIIELIDQTEKEKIIESVLSHRQNSLQN